MTTQTLWLLVYGPGTPPCETEIRGALEQTAQPTHICPDPPCSVIASATSCQATLTIPTGQTHRVMTLSYPNVASAQAARVSGLTNLAQMSNRAPLLTDLIIELTV